MLLNTLPRSHLSLSLYVKFCFFYKSPAVIHWRIAPCTRGSFGWREESAPHPEIHCWFRAPRTTSSLYSAASVAGVKIGVKIDSARLLEWRSIRSVFHLEEYYWPYSTACLLTTTRSLESRSIRSVSSPVLIRKHMTDLNRHPSTRKHTRYSIATSSWPPILPPPCVCSSLFLPNSFILKLTFLS